ncbi:hypothetical protein JO972_01380 [Verrucomicrobiaceae bacterium 5K15]|uniref:Toluene tolerance protein n=1 Tax=Oceaniferula flava TaxID=2800421 RepID=A0AAE2SB11_9BACT|nr:hypothetical protein [Oceaniferula flavus]MBK1853599.1 hypothetical protein [Oceaniferula flavus]MBM1134904.1 hypothetical protein [Oceaniferula flavus]
METITQAQLDELCANGRAIDQKSGYPAVVLHPDGSISKIWARKKGLFSSSTLRPYAQRFVKNAQQLKARGITVPDIIRVARLENSHVRLVTYRGLPGTSIRELLEKTPQQIDMQALCQYIAELHEKGILFGGMHLGNILQMDSGFGLIDFTDVRFFRKPLTAKQRAHNLRTPLRYDEDIARIRDAELPDLVESYLAKLPATMADDVKRELSA